jgi:hypothetical protein
MLTQTQVQRYANESGLRDIMIAEKEVVLTFLLQLLSERGILERLALKGGTCLRKMFIGPQGRFSTDLDFTGTEEHDHEDVILYMMEAFAQPYHGIQFAIPDEGYYETQNGLSWGVNPAYSHDWNQGGSEITLQISRDTHFHPIPSWPLTRGETGHIMAMLITMAMLFIVALLMGSLYAATSAKSSRGVWRPLGQGALQSGMAGRAIVAL